MEEGENHHKIIKMNETAENVALFLFCFIFVLIEMEKRTGKMLKLTSTHYTATLCFVLSNVA